MEISSNKIFKWIFQFWQNCIFSILPLCTYISQIECKQYFLSTICYRVHHISLKKMNFYHFLPGATLTSWFSIFATSELPPACTFMWFSDNILSIKTLWSGVYSYFHTATFSMYQFILFLFCSFFCFVLFLSHMTGWLKMSRTADMSWRIF